MDVKKVLLKLIDEQGLLELVGADILDGVILAKLNEFAAKSDNALDDALVQMIYPSLKEAVMKFLAAEVAKLQE